MAESAPPAKRARTDDRCIRCDLFEEYSILTGSDQVADWGYVLLDVPACPVTQLCARIRQLPYPAGEDPGSEVHGVTCDTYRYRPALIHVDDECIYCSRKCLSATADCITDVLGGIQELGDLCTSFLWTPSMTNRPIPTPPREDGTGRISWADVEADVTYQVPGSKTKVVSSHDAFTPFTAMRVFCATRETLALRNLLETSDSGREFTTWKAPADDRPYVIPLLNAAIAKARTQQGELVEGEPRYTYHCVDVTWGMYKAHAEFKDICDGDGLLLTRVTFESNDKTYLQWSIDTEHDGPEILSYHTGSLGAAHLSIPSGYGGDMIMGVRQGCWVYGFFFGDMVGTGECVSLFIERTFPLEPLCETPMPAV